MRGLNLRSFRKVGGDDSHSIMQHNDGHQIKILHKPLSPDMKKQLMKLPVTKMADGGSVSGNPDPNFYLPTTVVSQAPQSQQGGQQQQSLQSPFGQNVNSFSTAATPAKPMAEGGKVDKKKGDDDSGIPGGSGSPYQDPDAAKGIEKGATEGGTSAAQAWQNLKTGLGFADGGKVADKDDTEKEVVKDLDLDSQPASSAAPAPATNFIDQDIPAPAASQFTSLPANSQAGAVPLDQANNDVTDTSNTPAAAPDSTNVAPAAPTQQPTSPSPLSQYGDAQNTYLSNLKQGIGEEVGGKYAEAKAIGDQGKKEAGALQDAAALFSHIQNTGAEKLQSTQAEIDNVTQDIKNSHIDPNHYLGSMDTPARLATGIGLLLSGFGSGLSGKSNMAMDFLDKQIQRDVDAQKADLGRKENLVSAYQRQYGNIRDATQMAIATQGKLLENQLLQAAATSKDPIAQARATQAAGEVHEKYAAIPVQVAKNQALIQLTGGTQGSPERGTQLLNVLRVSDPQAAAEVQKRAVPDGKGGTEFAQVEVTPADRDTFKGLSLMDSNAKDLLQFMKKGSSMSLQDRQIAEQKALALQAAYRENQLNTVYKKGEQPLLDKAVNESPLSFTTRILGTEPGKIQELINSNQRTLKSQRQKLGLPVSADINFQPK